MARADRLLKQHLRTRFVVTTQAKGETFSGLVIDVDERTLELADVQAMNPDGSRTPIDGRLFLPRDDVAYMQIA